MATRKRDRFFAGFGALLFLGTASALTIAVIAQGVSNHSKSNNQSSNTNNAKTEGKQLQGTQLDGFTPGSKIDKLSSLDIVKGTGDVVKAGDTITVDYTGALAATGTIFQSSKDSGQKFTTVIGQGQVIKGWDEGVPGMKVGGTRRLFIPSSLAYGSQSQSGIPANSDLVFDITVYAKQ